MAISKETELYGPVKAYWEARGYTVRGEVKHCDLVAMREEEPPVVVELKRSFSVPLLVQGIDRQRLTDRVYVAIELPNKRRAPHGVGWDAIRRLCVRLGLGLLTVRFYKSRRAPLVEAVCHPPALGAGAEALRAANSGGGAGAVRDAGIAYGGAARGARAPAVRGARVSARAAAKLAAEFGSRHGDFNVGGSPGGKRRVTAYRERALLCAAALRQHGPLPLRTLRERTGCAGAALLMQRNDYGWFQRHQRGTYGLTPEGEAALTTYAEVVVLLERDLPQ